MEYYLYISDSKVDMLFSQLPQKTQSKITAEFGVNTGLVKAAVKSERDIAPSASGIARLQAVTEHIRQSEDMGIIDDPASWIEDTQHARIIFLRTNDNIVFFVGETSSGARFALGGSAAHVFSGPKPEGVTIGWSFLPYLLKGLEAIVRGRDVNGSDIETMAEGYETEWMDLIKTAERSALEPEIKISFLAKRLLVGKYKNDSAIGLLATPLYVSMAE